MTGPLTKTLCLLLTLLAVPGSMAVAQFEPSQDDIPKLFQQAPESPADLVRAASIAAGLQRIQLAREYLQIVVASELSEEELLNLREGAGIDVILKIHANPELQPMAGTLLKAVNRASAEELARIESADVLVKQLGVDTAGTLNAAMGLLKHGDAAAEAMLAVGTESQSGQLALELFHQYPRLFRRGIVAALPKLPPTAQVQGLRVVGAAADPTLAGLLLGYEFGPDQDEQVRVAAKQAIERLWDSGTPPVDADSAVGWLTQQAARVLSNVQNNFSVGENQTPQRALVLAQIAAQIEPGSLRTAATLLACRLSAGAATDTAESPEVREAALQIVLDTGGGPAVSSLLGTRPDQLRQAMDLTAPATRLQAAISMMKLPPSTRGSSRANILVQDAAEGSQQPEAVVIDPRIYVATLGKDLLTDQGYDAVRTLSGQHGFEAAARQLRCELILIHSNCTRWSLSKTIANLRADIRTAQTPIVIYGPRRSRGCALSLQSNYEGLWFMTGPVSELNFANELRRLHVPAPRMTQAERSRLIQMASNALAN